MLQPRMAVILEQMGRGRSVETGDEKYPEPYPVYTSNNSPTYIVETKTIARFR